ncbi:MAG TPA: porin [Rhodopila sp.]|uniref:porin n=1 Tax=Rhodopila sp. TaxID=2480087 RepID=UPI002BC12647|nr:porin [Rhodopila sp.]HVY17458.1 porin [Rhodopila sp.]
MKTWCVSRGVLLAAAAAIAPGLSQAVAQTAPAATTAAPATAPAPTPAADAPPPGLWIDGIHLSAQLDAGFNINPSNPRDGKNFGQLFTDYANQATINQLLLTANKPLDPKDSDFQWGFKLQGMYGSDARYTQYLGIFNNAVPGDRYQFDIVEANALFHLPVVTSGGLDLKVGLYPTPLGYETIDPSTNPFYTHSYIFQFGLPFKHTGGLAVLHVNDMLDVYGGVDTGTNTTFGVLGENNSAIGGITGVNLTLMGGNLTVLALTHFGPEQASRFLGNPSVTGLPTGYNADGYWRYYNDIVITYKATDALTLVTELNLVRDDFGKTTNPGKPVNAFGIAQYASYALSDTLTLNGRAELFRDDNNFFVASYANNNDPVKVQQGFVVPFGPYAAAGSNATYTALTVGVTWKPNVSAPLSGLLIRPEVRWDHAFASGRTYNVNSGTGKGTLDNVTFAADAVITF